MADIHDLSIGVRVRHLAMEMEGEIAARRIGGQVEGAFSMDRQGDEDRVFVRFPTMQIPPETLGVWCAPGNVTIVGK